MVHITKSTSEIEVLFGDWQETMIWSCLSGTMGNIYADSPGQSATCAAAMLGDFCFLAGKADGTFALDCAAAMDRDYCILVPQNEAWSGVIEEAFGGRAKKITRYATGKNPAVFDWENQREKLREIAASLPGKYELALMDEALFQKCRQQPWSRDLTGQFTDFDVFNRLAVGVVALCGGEIISGASSYSAYPSGIEIEVDTREDFRRKGLAAACSARLILECLQRGLYPSWDAHNEGSLKLAEKLGYEIAGPYTAYEVTK